MQASAGGPAGNFVRSIGAQRGQVIGNCVCVPQEDLLGRQLVVPLLTRHVAQKGWLVSICREAMETIQAVKFNPFPELLPSDSNTSPNSECRTSAVSV